MHSPMKLCARMVLVYIVTIHIIWALSSNGVNGSCSLKVLVGSNKALLIDTDASVNRTCAEDFFGEDYTDSTQCLANGSLFSWRKCKKCPDGFTKINEGNSASCIKLRSSYSLMNMKAVSNCKAQSGAILPIFNSVSEFEGFKNLVASSGLEAESFYINGDIQSNDTIYDGSGSVKLKYPKASEFNYDATKTCLTMQMASIVPSNCNDDNTFACQLLRCPLGWTPINEGDATSCVILIKTDQKNSTDAELKCKELDSRAHLPFFKNHQEYFGFGNLIAMSGIEGGSVHINGDIRSDGTIYDRNGTTILQYPAGDEFGYDTNNVENCLSSKMFAIVKINCSQLAMYACQLMDVNF